MSEVEKKASALKLGQVERLVLQQAGDIEKMREKVRASERECELMNEKVSDSAVQRERLILVERDVQQHRLDISTLRTSQDGWQEQLAALRDERVGYSASGHGGGGGQSGGQGAASGEQERDEAIRAGRGGVH